MEEIEPFVQMKKDKEALFKLVNYAHLVVRCLGGKGPKNCPRGPGAWTMERQCSIP